MCRICHCVTEETETLISPCDCKGSMKWVHQACLQRWVKSSDTKKCELCGFSYNMISSVKPFSQVICHQGFGSHPYIIRSVTDVQPHAYLYWPFKKSTPTRSPVISTVYQAHHTIQYHTMQYQPTQYHTTPYYYQTISYRVLPYNTCLYNTITCIILYHTISDHAIPNHKCYAIPYHVIPCHTMGKQ